MNTDKTTSGALRRIRKQVDNVIHVSFKRRGRRPKVNDDAANCAVVDFPVPHARALMAHREYLEGSRLDEDIRTSREAVAHYERAIQLDPKMDIAYTNLGNIYHKHYYNSALATEYYLKALKINPRQIEATYNLGYVRMNEGRYDEAIALFKDAISYDRKFADAYFNLAMAYWMTKDARMGVPYWRKYLELQPEGCYSDTARENLSALTNTNLKEVK